MTTSIFKTLVILVITLSLTNCSTENEELTQINNLSKLAKDATFLKLTAQNTSFNQKVKQQNVSRIEELTSKGENISSTELYELSSLLGFDNIDQHSSFVNQQNELYQQLEEKYNLSSYSAEQIAEAIMTTDISIAQKDPYTDCIKRCSSGFDACHGVAVAEALVVHVGCAIADVTIVAGLICHASAGLFQWSLGVQCVDSEKQCIATCPQP